MASNPPAKQGAIDPAALPNGMDAPPLSRREAAKQARRIAAQLGPSRLALTMLVLVVALLAARLAWFVPLASVAERGLFDWRVVATAPLVEQDQRLVMVTYTDETLFSTGIRSPVDRAILARALVNLDAMGARAIGIDIGFDSPRPEDPALKAQLRAMQTPTWLAYADHATNRHTIMYEQQQFLDRFIADVRTDKTRPASVRFATDGDGRIRRWPDRPPGLPPFLANAMIGPDPVFDQYQGSIRFLLPAKAEVGAEESVIARIPIDNFGIDMDDDLRAALAEAVRGKYVLIGGDIVDVDRFDTPLRSLVELGSNETTTMVGMEVHAHMLAQQLDGAALRPMSGWVLWAMALLMVIAGGLTSLADFRPRLVAALFLFQMAFILVVPFWLHAYGADTYGLPAFGWAVGWLLGYVVVGTASRTIGAKQRAFAQSALGKYLPRDIAQAILRDPDQLSLHGEKREIYCVFTDLEGFTALSHAVEPETVARLLNAYLDQLSAVVLAHGGTIDKFVGDAVVAFWGAPIARTDDAQQAVAAALAMHQAGERFRRDMAAGVPPIGRTRVGLHVGEAIVGNFGGEGRMQYTALGDSMNTAARLESANKQLSSGVLISGEVAQRAGRDDLVPLGRIRLRGRARPVDVFEPRPDLAPELRSLIADMVRAHASDDIAAFVTHATDVREQLGQDPVIMALLERLETIKGDDSYALS